MGESMFKMYVRGQTIWRLVRDEGGQDLVEYAAVVVIVVLGLTAAMRTLASSINTAMTNVGAYINQKIG